MAQPDYPYRALVPISHGGVMAYQPGDLVPAENVADNGYEVGVQVELVDQSGAEEKRAGDGGQGQESTPGGGQASSGEPAGSAEETAKAPRGRAKTS